MSLKNTVGTLAQGAVTTAVSVVRHPIGSASMAAGLVKGTAGASVDLVRGVVTGRARSRTGCRRRSRTTSRARSTSRPSATEPTPDRRRPRSPLASEVVDAPGNREVVPKPVPEIDELPEPVVIEARRLAGRGVPHRAQGSVPRLRARRVAGRPRGGRGVRRGDPREVTGGPSEDTLSGARRRTRRSRPLSRSPRSRPRRHRSRPSRTGRSEPAARPRTLEPP